MKSARTLPALALTILGLALAAIVLMAVVPLLSGGLTVDETDETSGLTLKPSESGYLKIEGSYTVRSTLPYDVEDAQVSLVLGPRESNLRLTMFDTDKFTIPKNGDYVMVFDEDVFIPFILFLGVSHIQDDTMKVPATLLVAGSYIQGMAKVSVDIDLKLVLSTGGLIVNLEKTETGDGGDYEHFKLSVDGLNMGMEDGVTSVKIGDADLTVTISGSSAVLECSAGDEGIVETISNARSIDIDDPPSSTELSKSQAKTLSEIIDNMLEGE